LATLEGHCSVIVMMRTEDLARLIADLKRLPKDERLMLLAVLLQS
jgi:hypothetical protein